MRSTLLSPRSARLAVPALVLLAGPALIAGDVDNQIVATAKSSYNFKTYLKDDSIKIESDAGVVTLTGTVAQNFHRSLAEETVAGLPGVKQVQNRLTVNGEQPAERSDGWITLKVKAALTFHKSVSAATNVETQDGIVTLKGQADSSAQRDLTTEYAKDVEGVREVRNEMTLAKGETTGRKLSEKVDDASITAQVKAALLFHKSTHVLATKVLTRGGVVTLKGEARNESEKALVTKLTEDIRGVRKVDNRMTAGKG